MLNAIFFTQCVIVHTAGNLTHSVELRFFVARNFLSQIYAPSSSKFSGLKMFFVQVKIHMHVYAYHLKKDSAEYFAVEFMIPSCLVNTSLMVNGSILDHFGLASSASIFFADLDESH